MQTFTGTLDELRVQFIPAYFRRFRCHSCGRSYDKDALCLGCEKAELASEE